MINYVIYVLLLDDSTRYVGLTSNIQERIQAHMRGYGSIHTKGKGIILVEEQISFQAPNKWYARLREYSYAEELRGRYGVRMVRGGELGNKKVKEFKRKALLNF